jgi:hypothetical protein
VASARLGTGVQRASASALDLACVGLAQAVTAVGASVPVQLNGPLTLADWSAVTGTAFLNPRSAYFLAPAANGMLTDTPNLASGVLIQQVGIALSSDTLLIDLAEPIEL